MKHSTSKDEISVTVVIPCYRCGKTIARAISSVAAQTKLPASVILVDDFSDDGTAELLRGISLQYAPGWIQVIEKTENSGPGSARNVGWDRASTDYIAFLDSDDSWHPRKLEMQYTWMRTNPGVVISGHVTKIATFPVAHEDVSHVVVSRVGKWMQLLSNQLATRSVMLRRNVDLRFEEGKRHSEDFLLWNRIMLRGHDIYKMPATLGYSYKNDFGATGLTGNLWKMQRGVYDTYNKLHKEGFLTLMVTLSLLCWSTLTFVRRFFVAKMLRSR